MNWTVYIVECVIMMAVFGFLVFESLCINPVSFIGDYPPEIQERYYQSQHKEVARSRLTMITIVKKIIALVAFAFLFAWMAHLAGARTFREGLTAAYGYILAFVVFDICILDWLLFPNIMRIRLPGTEDMDREYHQKWFHVKAMLPMLPVFIVGGVAIAALMVWVW